MNKTLLILGVLVIVVVAGFGLRTFRHGSGFSASAPTGALQVVAAENFWGSLVSQLGGSHVQVLSIVSDPNADPHEYESSSNGARAIATANYVIENGAGYDSWADKLLGASSNPNRKC